MQDETIQGLMSMVHDGTNKVGFQRHDGEPIAMTSNLAGEGPTIKLIDPAGKQTFKAPIESRGRRR